jgi:hypothetical protein
VGKLPGWAKTKIIASSSPPAAAAAATGAAKSRWGAAPPPLRPSSYDNIIVEDDSSPKEGSSLEWSARGTPSSMSEMGSMSPHPAAQIRYRMGSGLRIRIFSIPDPGCASNKWFPSSWKYDPGCSTRIRIRSRIKGSKRHRISDPDPQHWMGFFATQMMRK